MNNIDLNPNLTEILTAHGIIVSRDREFIHINLQSGVKFKATAYYTNVNKHISSQLDAHVITDNGEAIVESFGDFGTTIDEAINSNLKNFCAGSLHVLLAAFGSSDHETLEQVQVEEWEVNNRRWTACIGGISQKQLGKNELDVDPTREFFNAIESGIKSLPLIKPLNWFRGFYSQYKNDTITAEFMMNNQVMANADTMFSKIPRIRDIEFYSCRNFIILRQAV